jgi:hypothetical protein
MNHRISTLPLRHGSPFRTTPAQLASILFAVLAVVGCSAGTAPQRRSPTPASVAIATPTDSPTPTASPTQEPGTFIATGALATGRQEHTATLLLDGRVLIAGGWGSTAVFASAELYDPKSGKFSPTGSMNETRAQHTATLLGDGRVLIVGGEDFDGNCRTSAELYDPTAGTFSPTGSMTLARQNHTATLLADGRVLVVGGDNRKITWASAEVYDPKTGLFTSTGPMGHGRLNHTATLLKSGKVLIVGGEDLAIMAALWKADMTTELYDPATGKFSRGPSMSTGRSGHTATLMSDGRVLIAGGFDGKDDLKSAVVYDSKTGLSNIRAMAATHWDHTATLLLDGRVLIVGGFGGEVGSASTSAELVDLVGRTSGPTERMSVGRLSHTATLLLDGRVLITGGQAGPIGLNSADLYQP